jgi:hypothetical protein
MAIQEIERRVILFKSTTTMPDDSQLGWDANPNAAVNGNTPGESLIYNSPLGTQYIQNNGTHWRKTVVPNTWTLGGSGGASVAEWDASGHTPGVTSKDVLVDTDLIPIFDSEDGFAPKYVALSNLSLYLGTVVIAGYTFEDGAAYTFEDGTVFDFDNSAVPYAFEDSVEYTFEDGVSFEFN